MAPTFSELKDYLEAASYLATIIGIPVAIAVFVYQKRKDREEQEKQTYLYANDKYVHYLELCLQHPALDCFDVSVLEEAAAPLGLDIQKLTLLTILICTLETGYLLYKQHEGSKMRGTQWQGWSDYMREWASRPDFRTAWQVLGGTFDKTFQAQMDEFIRTTSPMAWPDKADRSA